MKLQKQPVGWLVVWLAGWSVGWLVGWLRSVFWKPATNRTHRWKRFWRSIKRPRGQLAGRPCAHIQFTSWPAPRERETENRQTHYLIDTAALESTEAEIRAVERAVDRGYLFVCLLIFDTVDAASGQLNNLPNTLARFSHMLHSQNSVCLTKLPNMSTLSTVRMEEMIQQREEYY
ncbi:hypothetical protein Tsp_02882 [Trichinella spiralis]|uniref:hypothetical protein n=1 Tax=Trichinella spiralis TaxID=6334 RepID=UPI0001EFCB83|nr:hypothetical protein Tsp_02882 [Trichinella spiralis]